ncbi:MAG: hypothetical protein ACKOBL_18670, partial [Chloroflexota bacterium]
MAKEVWEIKMSNTQRELLFVFAITLLAASLRLSAPLSAFFPLNDGGLFFQMITDLQSNSYKIPDFTSYNFASIPYAYPPLAFYFYG